MTRATLADYGMDPNPLGIQWHWKPADDVDRDAFYEPLPAKGIAIRVPQKWVREIDPDGPPEGRWRQTSDLSAADFKAFDLPEEPAEIIDDEWRLMRISCVETIVFQQQINSMPGLTKRGPDPGCVARFLHVDNDIRRSA